LKKNWHLSLAVVCMVLGVLLAMAFNTQQRNREALNAPRKENLIKTVHGLEKERDNLKAGIESIRGQISKYENSAAQTQGILSTYTRDLNDIKKAAGLTDVKGPGLIVTLADSQQSPKDGEPNDYVIHDYDIRLVVNSLWAGGAKAVSVNGQRLISTSSVRCAGGYVLVNSMRLVSPFTIKAVGNSQKMVEALEADTNTKRLLNEIAKFYGLKADVEQKEGLTVPGYTGSLLMENAKVVKGAD